MFIKFQLPEFCWEGWNLIQTKNRESYAKKNAFWTLLEIQPYLTRPRQNRVGIFPSKVRSRANNLLLDEDLRGFLQLRRQAKVADAQMILRLQKKIP